MIVVYVLGIVLLIFSIVYIVSMLIENEMRKRNPIPKQDNSDKRFSEVRNIYVHEMYRVTRGN